MNFEIFSQVTRVAKDTTSKAVLTEYSDAKLKIVERISKAIKEHNKVIREQRDEPKHIEAHIEKVFLAKYAESDSDEDAPCELRTPAAKSGVVTPTRGKTSFFSGSKGEK
jgi:hypothetical protein